VSFRQTVKRAIS